MAPWLVFCLFVVRFKMHTLASYIIIITTTTTTDTTTTTKFQSYQFRLTTDILDVAIVIPDEIRRGIYQKYHSNLERSELDGK